MTNSSNNILIGVIGAPHGIRGHVKLRTFSETPTDIAKYPLYTEDGTLFPKFKVIRWQEGGFLIISLSGIEDRDKALELRGTKLYVKREDLPAPAEDTFYYSDLEGLQVQDTQGKLIGKVLSVENYGAGPLLEIQAGDSTFLAPFKVDIITAVDLAAGILTIDGEYTESMLKKDSK
jgi:16S rRNA processing protein RimM